MSQEFFLKNGCPMKVTILPAICPSRRETALPRASCRQKVNSWALLLSLFCCILWDAQAHAAAPDKLGLGQRIVVLCARTTDQTPRKARCQDWVDQLNTEAAPWFASVSDGQVGYTFELPAYQQGATHPPNDWFILNRDISGGFYFGNINRDVMPVADPIVDFANVDRMVVIIASPDSFGQAGPGDRPENNQLVAHSIGPVGEGEEEYREQTEQPSVFEGRRRISTALMFESMQSGGTEVQRQLRPSFMSVTRHARSPRRVLP
jgi:hypothetical protein